MSGQPGATCNYEVGLNADQTAVQVNFDEVDENGVESYVVGIPPENALHLADSIREMAEWILENRQ